MSGLRTIPAAALHQLLRLSSRVSDREVRWTCQVGISISQTLHLLSLLVLPPRKGLGLFNSGGGLKGLEGVQGNRENYWWRQAVQWGRKDERRLENIPPLPNMSNISFLLHYFAAKIFYDLYPKAICQERNKRKAWSPSSVTLQALISKHIGLCLAHSLMA